MRRISSERLYPRLAALLKQVERVASQRAATSVPEETAKLSRELCREAAKLLGRDGRGIVVPAASKAAPLDHAALAVALSQAVAGLEAFEGEHAMLSAKHQAICWLLPDGKRQPVARHLPATPPRSATGWREDEKHVDAQWRTRFIARLVERENKTYLIGYHDALAGKPPRTPREEPDFV